VELSSNSAPSIITVSFHLTSFGVAYITSLTLATTVTFVTLDEGEMRRGYPS